MFSNRLKDLRTNKNMTQDDLGKVCNVSGKTIGSWERGYRQPSLEQVDRMATFFGVTSDYLLGRDVTWPVKAEDIVSIPLVGTVKAGVNGLALEDFEGYTSFLNDDVKKGKDYFALRIKGDSMVNDGINEGDIALIERDAEFEQGKIYVVAYGEGEATLKRVLKADGSIVLQPSNNKYPAVIIAGDELSKFRLIGRLTRIKRNY